MKKILASILALTLIGAMLLPFAAMAEEEDLIYIFGGSSNKSRAKLKTMGQQSWYLMYSTQVNAGENIDLSTFKECVQTETGMWKPDEADVVEIVGYDPDAPEEVTRFHADWFSIRKDGFVAGDTGYSAAVKWVCEQDGVYNLTLGISGGSSMGYTEEAYHQPDGSYIPVCDGVYMSFFIKGELMLCEDTWPYEGRRLPQTDVDYEGVELKAGDEVWMVSDTKLNGGWDDPWWYLNITRVGDLPQE